MISACTSSGWIKNIFDIIGASGTRNIVDIEVSDGSSNDLHIFIVNRIMHHDARTYPNTVTYGFVRKLLHCGDKPLLLLFGTGFGMEQETMNSFDYVLEPVYGPCDYNHLCVRSAAAIILDRLAGEAWWEK